MLLKSLDRERSIMAIGCEPSWCRARRVAPPGGPYNCCTSRDKHDPQPVVAVQAPLEQQDSQYASKDYHGTTKHLEDAGIPALKAYISAGLWWPCRMILVQSLRVHIAACRPHGSIS